MVAVISTAHGLVSDQVPLVGGLAFFVTNKSHKLFQRLGEGSIAPPILNIWNDHGGTSNHPGFTPFGICLRGAIFIISYI